MHRENKQCWDAQTDAGISMSLLSVAAENQDMPIYDFLVGIKLKLSLNNSQKLV